MALNPRTYVQVALSMYDAHDQDKRNIPLLNRPSQARLSILSQLDEDDDSRSLVDDISIRTTAGKLHDTDY